MKNYTETLASLESQISKMLSPDSRAFTQHEFLTYAQEQIKLAKTDADAGPRLAKLVESLAVAKTWEEPDSKMTLPVFTEPAAPAADESAAAEVAKASTPAVQAVIDEAAEAGQRIETPVVEVAWPNDLNEDPRRPDLGVSFADDNA